MNYIPYIFDYKYYRSLTDQYLCGAKNGQNIDVAVMKRCCRLLLTYDSAS